MDKNSTGQAAGITYCGYRSSTSWQDLTYKPAHPPPTLDSSGLSPVFYLRKSNAFLHLLSSHFQCRKPNQWCLLWKESCFPALTPPRCIGLTFCYFLYKPWLKGDFKAWEGHKTSCCELPYQTRSLQCPLPEICVFRFQDRGRFSWLEYGWDWRDKIGMSCVLFFASKKIWLRCEMVHELGHANFDLRDISLLVLQPSL